MLGWGAKENIRTTLVKKAQCGFLFGGSKGFMDELVLLTLGAF